MTFAHNRSDGTLHVNIFELYEGFQEHYTFFMVCDYRAAVHTSHNDVYHQGQVNSAHQNKMSFTLRDGPRKINVFKPSLRVFGDAEGPL
jgi:hypothetical protein